MTSKPYDVYTNAQVALLTATGIESQWFERKAHPPDRAPTGLREFVQHIAETICGFANNNPEVGGLFVVGVADNGEVHGVDRLGTDYTNRILGYAELLDGPTPEHKIVEATRADGAGDHIVLIYTSFLPNRVARTTNGQTHVRRGDKTITLKPDEAQAFAYAKGELQFEDEPGALLSGDDLEPTVVTEFLEQYARQKRMRDVPAVEDALRLARLTTVKDDRAWLTKGGVLAFHKDPRRVIPGAYVRYFRYQGRDRSTLIRDEQFEGPIPISIIKIRDFLPTQLARFSFRTPEGGLATEDEYPPQAWDEAVVNALVHRSYSQQTRPIWIQHFDDRFEVTSPGSYPLGVTPENLVHTPRNTHLMEALRYLNFVRMAEEGVKTMRDAMRAAGLPDPVFSPASLDRVTVTLLNQIDDRMRRMGGAARAKVPQLSLVTNVFPLRVVPPLPHDPDAPFALESGRPTFAAVRGSLLSALRSAGYHVDSFAGVSAVDFSEEHTVPGLRESRILSIYPGVEFRVLEVAASYFLVLDHTVVVRNRTNAKRVTELLPWLRLEGHRCFVRRPDGWRPGRIAGAAGNVVSVRLLDAHEPPEETISVRDEEVIPELSTVELLSLIGAVGVNVDLVAEVRKAALVVGKDAPRRRLDRIREIAKRLRSHVFPVSADAYELQLDDAPLSPDDGAFHVGHKLRDPKVQFDSRGLRQEDDIVSGLTTFGSLDRPQQEVPLVLMCPPDWSQKMQAFVARLRQGHLRFRGIESTFGLRLGQITTVISDTESYEAKAEEAIAQLPTTVKPVFIVFAPERGVSRANYQSSYYRMKRLLLRAGFPSQMVKEDTLENPDWKDLNFALDIFAKAGFVPWVLGEGMPSADLFVGLSHSVIEHAGQRRRLIGYANVFDSYGKWLFYEGASESVPFENRNRMFADLLKKIIKEYQAKRRKLQWVHIHHSAKIGKADRHEIARGVMEEASEAEVSFVHLNNHSAFRVFDESPAGDGAPWRGTWIRYGPNSFIVATTGANKTGQRYIGTPKPLDVRVNRLRSRGPLDLSIYAQHLLSLTRLNWASTRPFCHDPITIKFANDIAYLMNVILVIDPEFRLHENLRETPWFL